MTTKTTKEFKRELPASVAAGKPVQQGRTSAPAVLPAMTPEVEGVAGGGVLSAASAAFLVGAALGLAAGADQPAAGGANVHLSLDDEPSGQDRHDDYGCGL